MRRLILALLFLGIASLCFADVTAEIKGFTFDGTLIWAQVEYKVDGKTYLNPYPIQKSNLLGIPKDKAQNWLEVNILYQCDTYIEQKFKEIKKDKEESQAVRDTEFYKDEYKNKTYSGITVDKESESELIDEVLKPLIGKVYTRETAPLVKTSFNPETGETTIIKKYDVKTDGSYAEKNP